MRLEWISRGSTAAKVRRVHVFCGDARGAPPMRFAGKETCLVRLPERLEPTSLDGVVARVEEALCGHPRAELSLAGPTALAARLGCALKNRVPFTFQQLERGEYRAWFSAG